MTIASALTALNTDIVNARTAITNKGGTVTANGGSSQLATDIATIPSGGSAPVITSLNVTPTTSAQTITAPSGTDGYSPVNVAAVTASIDSNIIASNIKSGVSILGVNGTYEGSESIDHGGKYYIAVIDYDGKVLKEDHLNTGATFTLPNNPTGRPRLTFQEWSSPVAITNNAITVGNSDIIIGAIYTPTSGLSEFDITLSVKTGKKVILNLDGTKNWGDGVSDSTTTHTYSDYGDYTITCNGTTMNTSSGKPLFDLLGNNVERYICTAARLANIAAITSYAFSNNYSLKYVTISRSTTSIAGLVFRYAYNMPTIIIPSTITSIANNFSSYCYSLKYLIIPSTISSFGTSIIANDAGVYYFYIPSGITTISATSFANCSSLKRLTIPKTVTQIDQNAFQNCFTLIEYDFSKHTSIPTLSNTNAFTGINGICKIKVPISLASTWKTTTNWATYADYIEGV